MVGRREKPDIGWMSSEAPVRRREDWRQLISEHRPSGAHGEGVLSGARYKRGVVLLLAETRSSGRSAGAIRVGGVERNGSALSEARKMANHADTRTTQLYDRRGYTATPGEYEKVGI